MNRKRAKLEQNFFLDYACLFENDIQFDEEKVEEEKENEMSCERICVQTITKMTNILDCNQPQIHKEKIFLENNSTCICVYVYIYCTDAFSFCCDIYLTIGSNASNVCKGICATIKKYNLNTIISVVRTLFDRFFNGQS